VFNEPGTAPTTPPPPLPPPLPSYCPKCGFPIDGVHRCGAVAGQLTTPGAGSIKAALLTYFALLAVCMCGWVAAFHDAKEWSKAEVFWFDVQLSVAFAIVSAITGVACWRRLLPLFTTRVSGRWWLLASCLPIATFTLATACVTLVRIALGQPLFHPHSYGDAGVPLWAELAVIAVQPAIFEELTFRGVVLDGLRGSLSTREAVVVSAILFTILHCQVFGVAHLLAIGLTLGWLRVRTGSLLPGMVVHFGHNALCVLYGRLLGS
jgi:membrane protease YdiL (CAAX protease family)